MLIMTLNDIKKLLSRFEKIIRFSLISDEAYAFEIGS